MIENEDECSENGTGPSHNEALECLETAMKWLERQKKDDPNSTNVFNKNSKYGSIEKKQAHIKSFFA